MFQFVALLSKYAQSVLACAITPIEVLHRALMRGPLSTRANSNANQWAGRTLISSGSATVVISTTVINSDSLIFFGLEGNANLSSGAAIRPTEVKTISSGGYFTIGTQDGVAIARDSTVMWEVRRTT